MKKTILTLAAVALLPTASLAEDRVLPAQADDIARADANLGAAAKNKRPEITKGSSQSESARNNLGTVISSEAKALKDADVNTRKQFGASVAGQKRRDAEKRTQQGGSAQGSTGSSVSSGSAASNPLGQVPQQGGAAGSAPRPTSPGRR